MAQGKVCLAADVSVVAMTPDLGAEIRGVDLTSPLSDACFSRILEAYHRYCVIFLRDQKLDARLLVRFAARFGEVLQMAGAQERSLPGLPQVSVLEGGDTLESSAGEAPSVTAWHSDRSYDPAPPAATVMYGAQLTQGPGIEFVNTYAAFSALPPEKRLLVQKLRGVHEQKQLEPIGAPAEDGGAGVWHSEDAGVEHPLVRVHPETGKKALYLAKGAVTRIPGLSPADGRRLIDQLDAFATQPRFIYAHCWRKGDVVVWDNRCTLHRMTGVEGAGIGSLYRVWTRGEAPIAA